MPNAFATCGWCALVLLQSAGVADRVQAIPDDRRADTYAIYSLVLDKPFLNHPDRNQVYVIQNVTADIYRDLNPPLCTVPLQYEQGFNEVLEDHRTHQKDRIRIEPLFKAGRRYRLVDEPEAQSILGYFLRNPQLDASGRFEPPVPGSTDLIRLGNVYFSRDRRFALVGVSAMCGTSCGAQALQFVEKTDEGVWRRVKSCYVIPGRTT